MWSKLDDKAWKSKKLRRLSRAQRGLFWDLVSFCGDDRSDGFVEFISLPQLETSPTDPDLKALLRGGQLHKRGDECRCLDRRGWGWPRERGYLIHDWLDYNPSREENDVAKAQKAELRDPELRTAARARDFNRCRYCGVRTGRSSDHKSPIAEQLDHVDPTIAAGIDNLVIACKSCNSAKKKRTPEQAQMPLLTVADVRAKHYAELGIRDPDQTRDPDPTRIGQADGPGRDRVGSGGGQDRVQVGPPTTKRDSEHPNPYLRAGHGDPALEPPPPDPPPTTRPPPLPAKPRSQRPRRRRKR